MTPEDLDRIEARADAASEELRDINKVPLFCHDLFTSDADAIFIAHAREDVPALVAEVRRLREALSEISEIFNTPSRPDWWYRKDAPAVADPPWELARRALKDTPL